MMKIYFSIFLAIVFIFSTKAQTTVVLNAVKDNTIYGDFTNNSNGLGENLFSGNTASGGHRRALVKFDMAAQIPAGSSIVSVTLSLFCNKTIAGNTAISIHRLLADWGEGNSNAAANEGGGTAAATNDATWVNSFHPSTSWNSPGGEYASAASATTTVGSTSTSYTWSSSQAIADVQNWVNTPGSNFGWILIGNEFTSPSAKRFASLQNPITSQRPQLSVTYNAALPVVLSSFAVKEIKSGALLSWETAQELNNAYFIVEHSTDGTRFSTIGKVTGAGNSSRTTAYQFRHEGMTTGRHFYRLAQTDINGKVQLSTIKTIITNRQTASLQISPNPVTDRIILKSSVNRLGNRYNILSNTGIRIVSGILNTNGIDVRNLATGNYHLQVFLPDGSLLTGTFFKH